MKVKTDWKNKLKEFGLSVTSARLSILQWLEKYHGPFSVEELFEKIPGTYDKATFYRNLNSLAEINIIKEVQLGEGFSRYELNHHENHHHHHIICRICKKIESLEMCFIEEFSKTIKKLGFVNISHQLEFTGTCQKCSKGI